MWKIILASTATLIGGTQQVSIFINRNDPRFPLEFISVNDGRRLSGFGVMEIGASSFFVRHESSSFGLITQVAREVATRGMSLSGGLLDFNFERAMGVFTAESPYYTTLHIPGAPGSEFGRSIAGYLIAPVSESDDILVFNPTNPNEYALDGAIYYAPQYIDPNLSLEENLRTWKISTGFRVAERGVAEASFEIPDDRFLPCRIFKHPLVHQQLPYREFNDLLTQLTRLGIRAVREPYRGWWLHDVTQERLDQLPSIEMVVLSETGQKIHLLRINLENFLDSTDDPFIYGLRLAGALDNDPERCDIDLRLLENLLVHFDFQNYRIGFGEPLVEL